MRRRLARVPAPRSGFAGFRFPPEVIILAARWYLRYVLSYRDVEELLATPVHHGARAGQEARSKSIINAQIFRATNHQGVTI